PRSTHNLAAANWAAGSCAACSKCGTGRGRWRGIGRQTQRRTTPDQSERLSLKDLLSVCKHYSSERPIGTLWRSSIAYACCLLPRGPITPPCVNSNSQAHAAADDDSSRPPCSVGKR
ncbi:unnamed protein product, partial [Ectocarpus sp. 4 AP-2014]